MLRRVAAVLLLLAAGCGDRQAEEALTPAEPDVTATATASPTATPTPSGPAPEVRRTRAPIDDDVFAPGLVKAYLERETDVPLQAFESGGDVEMFYADTTDPEPKRRFGTWTVVVDMTPEDRRDRGTEVVGPLGQDGFHRRETGDDRVALTTFVGNVRFTWTTASGEVGGPETRALAILRRLPREARGVLRTLPDDQQLCEEVRITPTGRETGTCTWGVKRLTLVAAGKPFAYTVPETETQGEVRVAGATVTGGRVAVRLEVAGTGAERLRGPETAALWLDGRWYRRARSLSDYGEDESLTPAAGESTPVEYAFDVPRGLAGRVLREGLLVAPAGAEDGEPEFAQVVAGSRLR